MSFHEVQFPPSISFGSSGGPGFSTNIITSDSGAEQRVSRWANARCSYNVAFGIKSPEDMSDLVAFYRCRMGPAYGFRYKDWMDFSTAHAGIHGPPSPTDQVLIPPTSGNQWQLIKSYTSGGVSKVRKITKPVLGTIRIANDGTELLTGWTVDTTTGIVTFTGGSPGGVVTAGFEFDVPVRFGKEVDKVLDVAIDAYDSNSVSSITLVEILTEQEAYDDFLFGGAVEHVSDVDVTLSVGLGRVWVLDATGTINVVLPDTAALAPGGPYFYVVCDGSGGGTLNVQTATGTTVASVPNGSAVELFLSVASDGTKVWYGF